MSTHRGNVDKLAWVPAWGCGGRKPGVVGPSEIRSVGYLLEPLLAAVVKLTVVAGENLTVGSTVWLPAASVAPGR